MISPPNIDMDINDFGDSNADNYDDMRGCNMTFNKLSSRTILMSSNEALVDYATKTEYLNDIPNDVEAWEFIDSSQLSYAEPKEI